MIANRHALVESKHCGISGSVVQRSEVQSLAKLPSRVLLSQSFCDKSELFKSPPGFVNMDNMQRARNGGFC